ncbi:hypothetical protein ACLOJK_013284 [Asimina triloba]
MIDRKPTETSKDSDQSTGVGRESKCNPLVVAMALAGSKLLGHATVQFFIFLHLYNLLSSSVSACNLIPT